MTRRCGPGDIITLTAIFMTVRCILPVSCLVTFEKTKYFGFRALKAGLQADTYLEALGIEKHKQTYSELDVDYSVEVQVRCTTAVVFAGDVG